MTMTESFFDHEELLCIDEAGDTYEPSTSYTRMQSVHSQMQKSGISSKSPNERCKPKPKDTNGSCHVESKVRHPRRADMKLRSSHPHPDFNAYLDRRRQQREQMLANKESIPNKKERELMFCKAVSANNKDGSALDDCLFEVDCWETEYDDMKKGTNPCSMHGQRKGSEGCLTKNSSSGNGFTTVSDRFTLRHDDIFDFDLDGEDYPILVGEVDEAAVRLAASEPVAIESIRELAIYPELSLKRAGSRLSLKSHCTSRSSSDNDSRTSSEKHDDFNDDSTLRHAKWTTDRVVPVRKHIRNGSPVSRHHSRRRSPHSRRGREHISKLQLRPEGHRSNAHHHSSSHIRPPVTVKLQEEEMPVNNKSSRSHARNFSKNTASSEVHFGQPIRSRSSLSIIREKEDEKNSKGHPENDLLVATLHSVVTSDVSTLESRSGSHEAQNGRPKKSKLNDHHNGQKADTVKSKLSGHHIGQKSDAAIICSSTQNTSTKGANEEASSILQSGHPSKHVISLINTKDLVEQINIIPVVTETTRSELENTVVEDTLKSTDRRILETLTSATCSFKGDLEPNPEHQVTKSAVVSALDSVERIVFQDVSTPSIRNYNKRKRTEHEQRIVRELCSPGQAGLRTVIEVRPMKGSNDSLSKVELLPNKCVKAKNSKTDDCLVSSSGTKTKVNSMSVPFERVKESSNQEAPPKKKRWIMTHCPTEYHILADRALTPQVSSVRPENANLMNQSSTKLSSSIAPRTGFRPIKLRIPNLSSA